MAYRDFIQSAEEKKRNAAGFPWIASELSFALMFHNLRSASMTGTKFFRIRSLILTLMAASVIALAGCCGCRGLR
jgi:hypothetical protein